MDKILIADDEIKYRRLIKLFLENRGYEVHAAEDGAALLTLFSKHPDSRLIILDVMMPNLDGYETCKAIRDISSVPILMLTALDEISSEVKGFNQGADDYIAKPFSNELFVARVNALLRRHLQEQTSLEMKEGITFDEKNYSVDSSYGCVRLTQKEYYLLHVLVMNKDQIFSREQLLNNVWGYDYEGDPRTLDTHIKSLRKKIGDLAKSIITVRGKGYYYRSAYDV